MLDTSFFDKYLAEQLQESEFAVNFMAAKLRIEIDLDERLDTKCNNIVKAKINRARDSILENLTSQ